LSELVAFSRAGAWTELERHRTRLPPGQVPETVPSAMAAIFEKKLVNEAAFQAQLPAVFDSSR